MNSVGVLPEEVRKKYVISDCYVYVDLNDKLIEKWTTHVSTVIKDIKLREKDYAEAHSDKCFFDTDESVKEQSYYFANLCSYSRSLHKPYDEYCKRLESQQNGDIFGNLGSTTTTNNVIESNNNEVDLSWLNSI